METHARPLLVEALLPSGLFFGHNSSSLLGPTAPHFCPGRNTEPALLCLLGMPLGFFSSLSRTQILRACLLASFLPFSVLAPRLPFRPCLLFQILLPANSAPCLTCTLLQRLAFSLFFSPFPDPQGVSFLPFPLADLCPNPNSILVVPCLCSSVLCFPLSYLFFSAPLLCSIHSSPP